MRRLPAALFGLLGFAGCAMPAVAPVPGAAPPAALSKRGVVSVFPDLYGDPIPAGITAGPDGALWFTDTGNDVIGRITTAGSFTLEKPAGAELSNGIVTGPDKNLWFTLEEEYGGIGRITPDGVVTLFDDPGGAYPQGITVGPDGALWFAESNGTVGRMTTKGKVKHFTVAPSNAELEGIVTGPDGNLWVTQFVVGGSRFSNYVIRVSTNGKYKSYAAGNGPYGSGPAAICVGPDKALWFAEEDNDAIGRLTTNGKYEEFSTGDKYAAPFGIATGPDKALWFTDFAGRAGVGRMTTAGKVTLYNVPGSGPQTAEITVGPDRAMWFTIDLAPSAIGRVTTR